MKNLLTTIGLLFTSIFLPPAFSEVLIVHEGGSIQTVVKQANAGDTVEVMPGTYRESVFIDKDNITLKGVVVKGRWPIMDGEEKLNDGVLIAGHNATVERLWIKGYKGNAIMTQGGNNFNILRNVIEGPAFYGVFPQFSKNGLIAYNTISGIADAAIYVGMSEDVDVLYNETYNSVMGIETENSTRVLVEGNSTHNNSIGIAVVMVPGLPIKTGTDIVVRNNFITDNNRKNVAPDGSIMAEQSGGIGVLVLAADGTSFENNLIKDNTSVGIFFTDHVSSAVPPDPKMDPRPDLGRVLDNIFVNNGHEPKGQIKTMLASAEQTAGVDLFSTGEGRKNCVSKRRSLTEFGTQRWTACADTETTSDVASYQLDQPLESPSFTPEQMGRITYLSVCSGCHSYTARIIGPPMIAIQAMYRDNPEGLASYVTKPKKNWPGYPEMPPQNYLPEEALKAVANYIVYELEN
jgi:parallel beta-helix repeat protein